jgi:hypothetical protein
MGLSTFASGEASTAMGRGTEALAPNSLAVGSHNIAQTNSIFEVGIGTFTSSRKNAFTIRDNGFIGTADVLQPLSNLHLKYSGDQWNSHIRLEHIGDDYGIIVYDDGGFKLRTFGDGDHIYFRNSLNQTNALFNENGNLTIRGSLTQNSDRRLKKDLSRISSSLSNLMSLNAYQYHWKDNNRDQEIQTGLIAQEVQDILPELVTNGEDGYLSVNYIGLIPHLIEAAKELKAENDMLKADQKHQSVKMSELEDRLIKLEAAMNQ